MESEKYCPECGTLMDVLGKLPRYVPEKGIVEAFCYSCPLCGLEIIYLKEGE